MRRLLVTRPRSTLAARHHLRDRRLWTRWLYEARVRHGLCVLDYTVTSNHVHLVVRDQGRGEVAASMQLLESCAGQAYKRRKQRLGAFWQDRYHATAVESGEHLARCVVYVDLNMVRAGVVAHPREWAAGGYHESGSATGSSTGRRWRRRWRSTWSDSRRCIASGSMQRCGVR